eukprot:6883052-Lingulodinium_polyedra.AAC.1
MEPQTAAQRPAAMTALQRSLRLEAPIFSPSQSNGRTGSPLHRAALAAAQLSLQKQMLGDE